MSPSSFFSQIKISGQASTFVYPGTRYTRCCVLCATCDTVCGCADRLNLPGTFVYRVRVPGTAVFREVPVLLRGEFQLLTRWPCFWDESVEQGTANPGSSPPPFPPCPGPVRMCTSKRGVPPTQRAICSQPPIQCRGSVCAS